MRSRRLLASTKSHGDSPEVIERPLGLSLLYLLLAVSLLGCLVGFVPAGQSCKSTCTSLANDDFALGVLSAFAAGLIVLTLLLARWREHKRYGL
jgi:hypothetical protein